MADCQIVEKTIFGIPIILKRGNFILKTNYYLFLRIRNRVLKPVNIF
jgi:hypothetical protein